MPLQSAEAKAQHWGCWTAADNVVFELCYLRRRSRRSFYSVSMNRGGRSRQGGS